ncbi:MAG: GIY-YIG nuclease family protein [Myxococcota bacterium]
MRFDVFLRAIDPEFKADRFKIHLATGDGTHPRFPDPIDAFLAGELDEWQSWQSAQNFKRPRLITLIQTPQRSRWLFAGAFDVGRCTSPPGRQPFHYELIPSDLGIAYVGRLIVDFTRTGRSSYRLAENCIDDMSVAELLSEPMALAEFSGFADTLIDMPTLRTLVHDDYPSWRAALSSVSGVYVIADRETGKLYVGSATGAGGIWARWYAYANTGHGGNAELKKLLQSEGPERSNAFRFAILETGDSKATKLDMQRREAFWKRALLTREFGHNAN